MNSFLCILIGIGLNMIGFSSPDLWPWILFNMIGGFFLGCGISPLLKKPEDD